MKHKLISFSPTSDFDETQIIKSSINNVTFIYGTRSGIRKIYNRTDIDHYSCYIYFLDNKPYVGEGERGLLRTMRHSWDQNRKWEKVIAICEEKFNKNTIKFIENFFYNRIKDLNPDILNRKTPDVKGIMEYTKILANELYEEFLFISNKLNLMDSTLDTFQEEYDYYRVNETLYLCNYKNCKVYGRQFSESSNFIIYKDSLVLNDNISSDKFKETESYKLRQKLKRDGIIAEYKEHYIFTDDYIFDNISTAAEVIACQKMGRPVDFLRPVCIGTLI